MTLAQLAAIAACIATFSGACALVAYACCVVSSRAGETKP